MTEKKHTAAKQNLKERIGEDRDLMKELIKEALQEFLEAEMEEALRAGKGERTESRLAYRSGYYQRTLITRVGKVELRIPQDRNGIFRTEIFERYQRSEKALVAALAEMYVQGVSTRKVKEITEELCGHSFSASSISRATAQLDAELKKFSERPLEEDYPYLVLDAKYEKVREDGVIHAQAVLVAIGINWDGRRCILAVELAQRETETSWKELIQGLKARGLRGVEFVVSDHHAGLKRAIQETLPEAVWQRCYVHFLANAKAYLPRKGDYDCMSELRWLYHRHNLQEARNDLAAWLRKWQEKYPKLCDWVENNIEETLNFYALPDEHHKHMRSTNLLERINEELKRRTYVVRIFPNLASCLRLIRALAVEIHEDWIESTRYLNMEVLQELKKERLRQLNNAA